MFFKTCEKMADYHKVVRVFYSCKTREQLDVASAMGSFFCAKYAPYCIDELKRFQGIYSNMYCKLGLHRQEPLEEEDVQDTVA